MALDGTGSNFVMPVSPSDGGFGFGGADGGMWLILLFILLIGGNGFGGGFGGNGLYPFMNQAEQVNNGFRDQALGATIGNVNSGITSGFGDIQTALCGGFAG